MMSHDELSRLHQPKPARVFGWRDLDKFVRESNGEVRNLFNDEVNMAMECRYCRNMFRLPVDFVAHKRIYCRGCTAAVLLANQQGGRETEGKAEVAPKRRSLAMRENPVSIEGDQGVIPLYTLPRIMKEVQTITSSEDGIQKVIGSLPSSMAGMEFLPVDRTPVMVPLDNWSRSNEMSLGSQSTIKTEIMEEPEGEDADDERTPVMMAQSNSSRFKEKPVRAKSELKPKRDSAMAVELKIIDNFQKHDVRCGDVALLRCDHPDCAHFLPFHSVQALAYHCTLRHTSAITNELGDVRWPCLLCSRVMWSLEGVYEHMVRIHLTVKSDHLKKRLETEKREGKGDRKSTDSRRSRSLSFSLETKEAIRMESEAMEKEKEEGTEEEEDNVDRNLSVRPRGFSGRKASAVKAPVLKQPEMIQRLSGVSHNSDDYGDPPQLDDFGFEPEAEEEEDDKSLSDVVPKNTSIIEKENGGGKMELRVKMEVEEKGEEAITQHDPNTMKGCVENVLDTVCKDNALVGEMDPATIKNENTEESSTPSRARSASVVKKKGRSGKSLDRTDKPTVNRPKRAESLAPTQKVKRQYIKKKDREMMEVRAFSEAPLDAAGAARPSRARKRPSWMTNGGEEVYGEVFGDGDGTGSSQNLEQSTADESDYASTSKDEKKKKKTKKEKQVVTPVVKREPTPEQKVPCVIEEEQKKNEPLLFTPRAGQAVMERRRAMEEHGSKRKQNLGQLINPEEIAIVPANDGTGGPKRSGLATMPVYLSEQMQTIFFSGLILHQIVDGPGKTFYECMFCHVKVQNVRDGRRHMVAHIRIMRLRCGLCGAGSFFCVDMRNHLQLRGCPELDKAPQHMIQPGTPCMSKEHADELSYAAHSDSPGYALFTTGKIVSIISNTPYLPDPEIEEKILGPTRVPPRGVSTPLKEVVEGMDAAPAAAAADVSPSPDDTMPVLRMEGASTVMQQYSAAMEQYYGAQAAAARAAEQQQLQSGHNPADMVPPARRVLNFTTMPSGMNHIVAPTRHVQPSADVEMRHALPTDHRSMYTPIDNRRERSPDDSAPSTSY